MRSVPIAIIGPVLILFASALLPDKYRPAWIRRLNWWQVAIGLVAAILAFLIVMNPEFYALGLLGDSTFLDLLALAIGIQLQAQLSQVGVYIVAWTTRAIRFTHFRMAVTSVALALAVDDIVSVVHKVAHRFIS